MNEHVFTTIGASNHSKAERAKYDYYATEPKAVEMLTEIETLNDTILEPCCGEGHISKVLAAKGHKVYSSDLIERGFGFGGRNLNNYYLTKNNELVYRTGKKELDCLKGKYDIVTNPPYKYANEFTEKMLEILPIGCKLVQFLKLTFLESKARKELFKKYPLKTLHVSSSRLITVRNGDFINNTARAIAYGWFVWEKGYTGEATIKWFN